MIASLQFRLRLPWMNTAYQQLRRLSVNPPLNQVWTFNLSDLDEVLRLLGKPIEFNKGDAERIMSLSPASRQYLTSEPWKGDGRFDVFETPEVYVVQLYRKRENSVGEVTVGKEEHQVNKEIVRAVWQVIMKQSLNTPIKSSTIAENICTYLHLNRFFRDSNTFDWNKFFGERTDTDGYFVYFYYPIKVLCWLGLIHYRRNGRIIRTSDSDIPPSPLNKQISVVENQNLEYSEEGL